MKPALARGASRVGARPAPLGAPPDIIKELEHQRARQAEQLQIEAQARQQLEDMLLRIERHYKVTPPLHSGRQDRTARSCHAAVPTEWVASQDSSCAGTTTTAVFNIIAITSMISIITIVSLQPAVLAVRARPLQRVWRMQNLGSWSE